MKLVKAKILSNIGTRKYAFLHQRKKAHAEMVLREQLSIKLQYLIMHYALVIPRLGTYRF